MLKFRKIYLLLAFIVLSILIKTTTIQAQQDVITDYRSGEWSPDNRFIALFDVTGEDHSFRIFSGDLEPVASLRLDDLSTNEVELRGLAWSPDGTKLATIFFASGDPLVRDTYIAIWETQTWTEVQRFRDIGLLVTWSPDGQHIATGNSIWDAVTGELIQTFSGFRSISYVAWHPTNINQVLVASRGTAFILDVITGRDIAAHPYNEITAPVFSSDGQYLALHETYDPNLNVTAVDILDTSTYQLVSTIEYFGSLNERDGLSWRGNEAIVLEYIFAGADIVDITTAQVVDTISINQRNVWSDDGSRFLASGETFIDGRLSMAVFDAETESIIAQLASPAAVNALKITDGTGTDLETLLAGMDVTNQVSSGDGIVRLIQALTYPEDTVSVAFDLNGTVIIDNTAPYTIPLPSVGEYTLTATPYTQPDAQGDSGLALTVNVDVSSATASCDATVSASDAPGLVSAINTANGSSGADTICLEASTYTLNAVQNNNYGPNGLPAITSQAVSAACATHT